MQRMWRTDSLVLSDVDSGDAEWRVAIADESVDDDFPVVDAAREADTAQHESIVETAARRRHVAVG